VDDRDVEAFRSGRPSLLPHEVEELGSLDGLRLVHLQCHLGLDSVDIARLHPTVTVTGLESSPAAVETATELAREMRLEDRVRFVVADVYRAADVLAGERFDVVYTGKGALRELPDLDRWASMARELIALDGFLYLNEFHPVAAVLGPTDPVPVLDYFASETPDYQWQHPLSRVVTALLGEGFQLELFHEWDYTVDRSPAFLANGRWPPGCGTLPLMYSLKALPSVQARP
jgi:hypothetical protein